MISAWHGIQLALDANPDIILRWNKITSQVWETSLLATSYKSYRQVAGIHVDGSLGGPPAFANGEGFQRPAL